jgi:DNA-binding transcriptional ArsR family regulator
VRYANGDLFDQPAPAPPPRQKLPAQRVSANALEARPASDKDRTHDGQVLHYIKANGLVGITRNELHQRTGISIQTLSWSLGRLLKSGQIFRRQDTARRDGRIRFLSRDRCYLVWADLYRPTFASTDHPPFDEGRTEAA